MQNDKNNIPIQEVMIEKTLRTGGYVLKISDEEISEFERIYGTTDLILPEELQEPNFLYSNEKKQPPLLRNIVHTEKFAMAAREGKLILPDDIKNQMEFDRRNADIKNKRKK